MNYMYHSALDKVCYRHPLYMVADQLKRAFLLSGFHIVDNGQGMEVEVSDLSFRTWEEPDEIFSWQDDPVFLEGKKAVMRTRILPGVLKMMLEEDDKKPDIPLYQISFGRVYRKEDSSIPMRSYIEGIVAENEMSVHGFLKFWNRYAECLLGIGSAAELRPIGKTSFQIILIEPDQKRKLHLGYCGKAADAVMEVGKFDSDTCDVWIFIIDVDNFAVEKLSLPGREVLYSNDLDFLKEYTSNEISVGNTLDYKVIDLLRRLGYMETCGDIFYPDGIYVKMNMIQHKWDKNNQGYRLEKKLGNNTSIRTVQTPALEEILARNYKNGKKEAAIFEVGHIYRPVEGHVLPKEHLSISIGCYGPDVTLKSFMADIFALLTELGIRGEMFIPNDQAIAYQTDECFLIISERNTYLGSNFGRINEKAASNFGIGVPAYMAQLELTPIAGELGEKLPYAINSDDEF